MAQEAKVDAATHAPRDRALDEETCSRMAVRNRILLPTSTMMEAVMRPPTRGATIAVAKWSEWPLSPLAHLRISRFLNSYTNDLYLHS
jgi:hypothetical protein